MTPAIEVLSAEKTYPNGTQALLPVNLTVGEGEFVTLLGPSGCGKSTLLKMVAGLLPPSDGRLLLWRKPVDQVESTGHRLSFVFQEATLMPWARVQANVRLPLDLAGTPRDGPRAISRARAAERLPPTASPQIGAVGQLVGVDLARRQREVLNQHGVDGVEDGLGGRRLHDIAVGPGLDAGGLVGHEAGGALVIGDREVDLLLALRQDAHGGDDHLVFAEGFFHGIGESPDHGLPHVGLAGKDEEVLAGFGIRGKADRDDAASEMAHIAAMMPNTGR